MTARNRLPKGRRWPVGQSMHTHRAVTHAAKVRYGAYRSSLRVPSVHPKGSPRPFRVATGSGDTL